MGIGFEKLEKSIMEDDKSLFTIVSYVSILVIFLNLSMVNSAVVGLIASLVFFLINGTFLGCAFFEGESRFLRFMLGILLLLVFMGLVSWLVMLIYNLDIIRSTIVLCVVAAFCSFINKGYYRAIIRVRKRLTGIRR